MLRNFDFIRKNIPIYKKRQQEVRVHDISGCTDKIINYTKNIDFAEIVENNYQLGKKQAKILNHVAKYCRILCSDLRNVDLESDAGMRALVDYIMAEKDKLGVMPPSYFDSPYKNCSITS